MTKRHLNEDEVCAYALDIMDGLERAAAESHITTCSECAARLDATRHLLGLATPPQVPEASDHQVGASWHAILDRIATPAEGVVCLESTADLSRRTRRPHEAAGAEASPTLRGRWAGWLFHGFGGMPKWSWQMAQIIILAGIGFAAAWFLAGQGWLPGTESTPDLTQSRRSPSIEATRDWLAANGYAEQLEVLLLDLARDEEASGAALTPTVKEVSRSLLTDARWYRQAADRAGDPVLVELLSEIEIVLLAVATVPEGQEDDLVAILRDLIDDQDLLWRLRSVRRKETSVPQRPVVGSDSSG